MLQSRRLLTVLHGLGGEKQLHQLLGAELHRGLDCGHRHPLWRRECRHHSQSVSQSDKQRELLKNTPVERDLTFPLGM